MTSVVFMMTMNILASARIWSLGRVLPHSVCCPVYRSSPLKTVAIECVFLEINEKSTQCSKRHKVHLCCVVIY